MSIVVKRINRQVQVVRVGRRGLQGETGPQGPKGDQGDPATNLVQSVNGKQGVVVLNATDVGADPTGSSAQALQDAKDYTDTEVSTLDSSLATVAKTGSYNDLTGTDNVVENVGTSTDNALARFDGTTGKRVQNSGVILTDQDTLDGVSAVKFDTAGGVTPTAGSLSYNATEGVLDMGTGFTGTTIQVGMENVVRVRNSTGTTIANGAVVYVNGAQGNRPTVALADADIQAQAMAVIGVATHNIENNSDGLITTEGVVRELNTNAYSEGDVLYLSGTPGQFTTTPPVSPQTRVDVAVVTRAHNTQGEILVRPQIIVQKSDIGLGNVDNTSDADKPVSTATQTELNAKANASDTVNLTGNQTVAGVKTFSSSPIVPTATTTTQAVNKAQMDAADALKLNISDNRVELRGVGFPNGVVSAPVGTTYVDTAATNGAISWVKATGTGPTGWVVSVGDTGWRRLDIALVSSGYIYYRRIGQDVSIALGGGTFDSIMYATDAPINTRRRIVAVGDVPAGFRFSRAQTALLSSNSEFIVGTVYHSGAADANYIELRNSGRAIITSEFIRPASVTFQTNESWPTTLPGVSI